MERSCKVPGESSSEGREIHGAEQRDLISTSASGPNCFLCYFLSVYSHLNFMHAMVCLFLLPGCSFIAKKPFCCRDIGQTCCGFRALLKNLLSAFVNRRFALKYVFALAMT